MVNYREASIRDLETIVQFQIAMAWETEELRLDLSTCSEGVAAVFKNPHYGRYMVAEYLENKGSHAKTIGTLLIIPEWSDWRNQFVWWIHSVYILPQERKNGVFSGLFRFVEEKGLRAGVKSFRLYVDHRNQNAQAVYRHLGMTDEHYLLFESMKG